MNLLIPNISPEAAIPANSAITFPMFVITNPAINRTVIFTRKFSLIRSLNPFPVAIPILIPISCMKKRITAMGISVQSNVYPKCEPAIEYVAIPPASLSTAEVIIPGPKVTRKRRIIFLFILKAIFFTFCTRAFRLPCLQSFLSCSIFSELLPQKHRSLKSHLQGGFFHRQQAVL